MASSILNSDDGVISGTSGLKTTGGDDGVLKIQNNGTDAVTVAANGNVTLTDDLSVGGNASVTGNLTVTGTITGPSTANVQTFDTSGTWTKPASGSMARVQMWGGGGGGARTAGTNSACGGGGGAYNELVIPVSYLDSSVSITVGAGGAGRAASTGAGTVGGNTSVPFASYPGGSKTFYAYGGGGGITGGQGDGLTTNGGGQLSAGPNPTPSGYDWQGGQGTSDNGSITLFSGPGGSGAQSSSNSTGATSVYAGTGGSGGRVTSGFDATGIAAGGGGRNNNLNGGNGTAGRVIITVW